VDVAAEVEEDEEVEDEELRQALAMSMADAEPQPHPEAKVARLGDFVGGRVGLSRSGRRMLVFRRCACTGAQCAKGRKAHPD
jgi:hypothetical protein